MTSYDVATKYIIPERRMRLGRFDRLNDPFELYGANMADKNVRFFMKNIRDHWKTKLGVICMGNHWKSPLMWAHYAQSHTGVCLGFDVPDDAPRKIKYLENREVVKLDLDKTFGGMDGHGVLNVMTTKYAQWSYEEEWRLFADLDEKDPINGEFYLPFGPSLALREVIVGVRCDASVGSFRKLIGRVEDSVTIIKARAAFDTFTMVRQKNVVPIVIAGSKKN